MRDLVAAGWVRVLTDEDCWALTDAGWVTAGVVRRARGTWVGVAENSVERWHNLIGTPA